MMNAIINVSCSKKNYIISELIIGLRKTYFSIVWTLDGISLKI